MKLRILDEAREETTSAWHFLHEQSHELSQRFLDELAATLDAVASRPLAFAALETLPPGQPYRRALLATFRYAIIFEVIGDDIIVVAVAHTSREPNYWLGRNG